MRVRPFNRLLWIAGLPLCGLCWGMGGGAPTPQPSTPLPVEPEGKPAVISPIALPPPPEVTPLPAPLPPISAPPQLALTNDPREVLWKVEEGVRTGPATLVTVWTAEKSEKDTRITQVREGTTRSILAEGTTETSVRDRIARISVRLPNSLQQTDKGRCMRWLEFETLYGRRYFCEAEDTNEVFEVAANLRKLFPENRTPSSTRKARRSRKDARPQLGSGTTNVESGERR